MTNPNLESFAQLGVEWKHITEQQAVGVCPLCGKEKFYAHPETKLWDCKVCGLAGNFEKFLSWRMDDFRTKLGKQSVRLSRDRGIKPQTFKAWKVGYDPVTQAFYIPMDGNSKRIIHGLHRYYVGKYVTVAKGGKSELIAPDVIFDSSVVWLTEGEWDGMALWEDLRAIGRKEDVFSVPGAAVFPKTCWERFQGKDVFILFDNDTAGRTGALRTGTILSSIARQVLYLHWEKGLEEGFDVRDLHNKHRDAFKTIEYLQGHLNPYPPGDAGGNGSVPPVTSILPKQDEWKPSGKGITHDKVLAKYRKWLKITKPEVLEVLFGTVFANRLGLDPLWLFLVAPPGGAKSELLMSISDAEEVRALTTMTPHTLISGANFGGADPSLIPRLNGKVLVVKDFTTILTMNSMARDEIFGTLRDAYDGKIEKPFGNGIVRKYVSKFGIIAGVTPIIENYSSSNSVLGERFIRYRFRQIGRIDTGNDIIEKALMNIRTGTPMRDELSKVARETLSRVPKEEDIPSLKEETVKRLRMLAQYTASLRGVVNRDRYTREVAHKPVQEVGTRLAKQFASLCLGMAVYRNENFVSSDVLRTVNQVARDTVPDRVEEIVRQLYIHAAYDTTGEDGYFQTAAIASWTRFPTSTVNSLLQDLELLYIVNRKKDQRVGFWKLSAQMTKLIDGSEIYSEERHHAVEVHRVKSGNGGGGGSSIRPRKVSRLHRRADQSVDSN